MSSHSPPWPLDDATSAASSASPANFGGSTAPTHKKVSDTMTCWKKTWWTKRRSIKVAFLVVIIAGMITCLVLLFNGSVQEAANVNSTAEYPEDSLTVYNPPLDQDEATLALEAYETRRALAIEEQAAAGNNVLRAYSNLPVNGDRIAEIVATLETSEKADFDLMNLLRIMQYTDEFDDLIVPKLKTVLAWPDAGNSKTQYVYWSENHMIMWLCAIQLAYEKYGLELQDADAHRTRLTVFLNNKIKHGYIEFFSAVYMPFTFSALANLYDFSNDAEIKELAQGAAIRLLQDLDLITNDKGGQFAVAGRNYKEYLEIQSHAMYTMGWLLTGRGVTPECCFNQGANALATTTLDVSSILSNPAIEVDVIRESGYNRKDFDREWMDLNAYDRQLVAMSMGGYAHASYVAEFFATLSHYNLWDGKYFRDIKVLKWLPAGALRYAANVGAAYTTGSLLHAHIVLHKYKTTTLSTVQDYHKGLDGAQQWPFVATAGSAPVFLATGDYRSRNPLQHFPFAKQTENVALLVYSPSSDLRVFSRDNLDVTLLWPEESFSESSREVGNWIVGREDSGYVAVFRSCLEVNEEGLPTCGAAWQVWACVVGHEDTHGSFDEFVEMINGASVMSSNSGSGATSAFVQADGQSISVEWEQVDTGPAKLTLILVVVFVVLLLALCVVACLQLKPKETPDDSFGKSSRRCGCLSRRPRCLKTWTGDCLLITFMVLVSVLAVLTVAVLRLSEETHMLPLEALPQDS